LHRFGVCILPQFVDKCICVFVGGLLSKDEERLKLSSRLSAMTLRSVGKLDPPPVAHNMKECKLIREKWYKS